MDLEAVDTVENFGPADAADIVHALIFCNVFALGLHLFLVEVAG